MAADGLGARAARAYRAHPDAFAALGTAVAGVGLTLLGISGLWIDAPWVQAIDPLWHLLPILLGSAAMLVKRRLPFTALAVGSALFLADGVLGGSLGMLLVFFDLLYSAVLYGAPRRVRVLLAVIVLVVAAALIAPMLAGNDLRNSVFFALQAFVLLGTPYWWGMSVRRSRELAAVSEARARDAERLIALERDEAVREERERMARDLHDVIAGNLSAIAINAEAALAAESGERDRAALRAVRAASVAGLDEMRSMIVVLRTGDDPLVAPPRLAELPELVAGADGVRASLVGHVPVVPTAVDQALARVVGESLTNAARHTPGSEVEIRFDDASDAVEVTVTSTGGRRQAGSRGTGHGIDLMRERAERLGGVLEAGPAGDGWLVRARVPRSMS
ncbi:sensor histidine kinase [Agromyces aerolatus]|uniref:sensor histidine kinase n=1 Tax=Agromyces sp. LY-1074 TaxID=3074080 RepID=UPI002855F97C|nr:MULTISPECIES: histidine kinase [unclassified Agromyces]MDR5699179.1 histidine kinase [Agromyces sp. LY-1074]MDR5705474.1 histidine kinase [Agromyces sp. LY-1358]